MKRFLIKLGLFAGIHLAAIAVALALYVKQFPPSESFYAASLDKHRLLETRPSPRLVFIGGSSMALGMDSARVARPLGFQPVNMGMNVAIGLEFMIDEVRPHLRPGDVVVIAPEFHLFQDYYEAHSEYVARLIECRPALLRFLSFTHLKKLLDRGYLQHLGRICRTTVGWDESGLLDGALNQYNTRRAFNENGDVVAHHGAAPPGGSSLRFEFKSPGVAETAIAHLNRFHQECRSRGVRVFYSHAPYERRFFDLYRVPIEQLETMLKARLTIPMLDTAEEMTFPKAEIFDIEYHLNLAGKIRRSEHVAERLRQALRASEGRSP